MPPVGLNHVREQSPMKCLWWPSPPPGVGDTTPLSGNGVFVTPVRFGFIASWYIAVRARPSLTSSTKCFAQQLCSASCSMSAAREQHKHCSESMRGRAALQPCQRNYPRAHFRGAPQFLHVLYVSPFDAPPPRRAILEHEARITSVPGDSPLRIGFCSSAPVVRSARGIVRNHVHKSVCKFV